MNCNTTHYRANSSSVPGDPTDLLAIVASCGLAMLIEAADLSSGGPSSFALPVLAILQIMAFAGSGFYRRGSHDSVVDEMVATARAVTWASISTVMASMLVPSFGIGMRVILLDAYLLATMTLGTRLSFRALERLFDRERMEFEERPDRAPVAIETAPREPVPHDADEAATSRRGATVIPIRSAGIPN